MATPVPRDPSVRLPEGSPRVRRYLTSYHEAGHAVVGLATGLTVLAVALEDPDLTGWYGRTDLDAWPRTRAEAAAWARMGVAGYLAAARAAAFIGVPAPDVMGADHDREVWEQHCEPHGLDLWDAIVDATDLLTTHWHHVQELARELRAQGHVDVAKWRVTQPL